MLPNLSNICHQESRILIWSQRKLENFIFNSCLYEFEDVIDAVDGVDLIAPPQYNLLGKITKKIVKENAQYLKSLLKINPYYQSIYLEQDYDVFFTVLDFPKNLSSINSLKNWREKCEFAVCYLIEVWQKDIPQLKNFIEFFKDFDLVCLGHAEIVDDVQKIINCPCIYLPPGVDTVKFYPNENNYRPIDVCNLGRRSQVVHQALLGLAEEKDFFYYYDYISGVDIHNINHQQHRTFTSNVLKNSRYFITNHAKVNLPQQTLGQTEIGYRFFEGAAAGNILLGCPPKNEAFKHYFDWENAVIPIAFNEQNIVEIITELDSKPEYLKEIQTNNVVNSLQRHDWVYRWEQVLDWLGLPKTDSMEKRKIHLQQLAKDCQNTISHGY